jgi:ABC-type multidrug transport system permease subunit
MTKRNLLRIIRTALALAQDLQAGMIDLPMFVLFFASSALVPVSTMPGWLQPFARNQPATVTINAVRALFEGGPVARDLWQSVLWCVG